MNKLSCTRVLFLFLKLVSNFLTLKIRFKSIWAMLQWKMFCRDLNSAASQGQSHGNKRIHIDERMYTNAL